MEFFAFKMKLRLQARINPERRITRNGHAQFSPELWSSPTRSILKRDAPPPPSLQLQQRVGLPYLCEPLKMSKPRKPCSPAIGAFVGRSEISTDADGRRRGRMAGRMDGTKRTRTIAKNRAQYRGKSNVKSNVQHTEPKLIF